MSNKRLTKYYVLSPKAYDVLSKNTIVENKLNDLDKQMLNVLKNDKTSMGEKWLMYSQQLAKHGLNIRRKKFFSSEQDIEKTTKSKFAPSKTEQFTQTEEEEPRKPQLVEQGTQATQSQKDLDDEEYETLFHQHRSKPIYSDNDESFNQTLDEELNVIPQPISPPLRRSTRIKMQKMPKEFDSHTEEAAMLFVQAEMNDPIDRNYVSRKSLSPRRKIFEHRPTGSVISVDLEDVVEIVDEKLKEETKSTKRKHTDSTRIPKQKAKKSKTQVGKGISSIKWEKY